MPLTQPSTTSIPAPRHSTASLEVRRRSTRQLIASFCAQLFPGSKKHVLSREAESDGCIDIRVDFSLADLAYDRHLEPELTEVRNQDPAVLEYIMAVGIEAYCNDLGQGSVPAPAQVPEPHPTDASRMPTPQPPSMRPSQHQPRRLKPRVAEPDQASKRPKNSHLPTLTKKSSARERQSRRSKEAPTPTPTIPNRNYNPHVAPLAAPSSVRVDNDSHLNNLTGIERRRARQQMRRHTRQSALAQTGVMLLSPASSDVNTESSADHRRDESARFSILDTRLSKPGWKGLDLKAETKKLMNRAWNSQGSRAELREALLGCQLVPYQDDLAVAILDSEGLIAIYRSRIITRKHFNMTTIMNTAEGFVNAAQHPFPNTDMQSNARGSHWFSILGYDRNNRKQPDLSTFHKENDHLMGLFFKRGDVLTELTDISNGLIRRHFPGIWKRYQEAADRLKSSYNIEPPFGLFWNFCLNYARPKAGIPRVHCKPHVDHKNLALGLCMIFIFDLPLYTTTNGEAPAQNNLKSFACSCLEEEHLSNQEWKEAAGRGSMVWFSQATMFQSAELGFDTVKEAQAAGMSTNCNVEELMKSGLFPAQRILP
ncbi:hypothetical protein VKT23_007593 [Stygiomarasmius scandens]|uniref:Uncharacterized protein n=1 Tax=Marasmiellus scandens TaxID=2682957 RepID=A0ABR1JL96_9AGAR